MASNAMPVRSVLVLAAMAVTMFGASVAEAKAGTARHRATHRAANHPHRNATNTQVQTQSGQASVVSPRDPVTGQAAGTPVTTQPNAKPASQTNGFVSKIDLPAE
jgi:hypothetical protein